MTKAKIKTTIKLPNGTIIAVEGDKEDVKNILSLYSVSNLPIPTIKEGDSSVRPKTDTPELASDHIVEIVNCIKDCEEAELFETEILDRSSQVDRVLLSLYVAEKYFSKHKIQLTSGDVHLILKELGINMSAQNTSKTLHGTASKYVIGDKKSRKGSYSKYKINRRGLAYLSKVLHKQN